MRAPDRLGRLLAFGMTLLLVLQAALNIGVVTGILPTKGLALPFISYGGTNLITALFAVGTLMNVCRHIDVFDERMHTQVVRNAAKQV
jgi:cell division protein FtsW